MKKIILFVLLLILIIALVWYCQSRPKVKERTISGYVHYKDSALNNVEVEIQNKTTVTDNQGYFEIPVRDTNWYVVNAARQGFGFVSKIVTQPTDSLIINMAKATVVTIDLRTEDRDTIAITDVNPDIQTPLSTSSTTASNPLSALPFVFNAEGDLIGFEMPPAIEETYDAAENFQPPLLGAQVFIPKEGIELTNQENTIVDFSIQTIDIYTRDGMPGDNSVNLPENRRGYMESFGAATITMNQGDQELRLRKGFEAKVVIPVDTLSILSKAKLPETIPFLVYNAKTGLWEQEGEATLNKQKTAYQKFTRHFSTFNMDMVFVADMSSCYQVCNSITDLTNLTAEIAVPTKMKQGLAVDAGCPTNGGCDPNKAHGIIRLQPNSAVSLRIFRAATLLSTYVFVTEGAVSDAQSICPYDDCKGPVTIVENNLSQDYMKPNSTGMCHALVATPLRVSVVGTSHTIRLAMVYDTDFADLVNSTTFTIQSSNDGSTGWTAVAGVTWNTPPAPAPPLLYYGDFAITIANGSTKYFRVIPNGCTDTECSTIVKLTTTAMGDVDGPGTGTHPTTFSQCAI